MESKNLSVNTGKLARPSTGTQTPIRLQESETEGRITKSIRSGLLFPVNRIQRSLKEFKVADRVYSDGAVFISAVLEYLTAEVLETASEQCELRSKCKRKIIKPRDICLAIRNDHELNNIIDKDAAFREGGVLPFIIEDFAKEKPKKIKKSPKQIIKEEF